MKVATWRYAPGGSYEDIFAVVLCRGDAQALEEDYVQWDDDVLWRWGELSPQTRGAIRRGGGYMGWCMRYNLGGRKREAEMREAGL